MANGNNDSNNRISIRPDILVGKPVIKGTRIPVTLILNLLAHGYDTERIVADYPILTAEDVEAAVRYAQIHPDKTAAS